MTENVVKLDTKLSLLFLHKVGF